MKRIGILIAFTLGFFSVSFAQKPYLLKNISTAHNRAILSEPPKIVATDNQRFLSLSGICIDVRMANYGLWNSYCNVDSTNMIQNFSGFPSTKVIKEDGFLVLDSATVFFSGKDPDPAIWKTNWTRNGTSILALLDTGTNVFLRSVPLNTGAIFLILHNDSLQLWFTDGTAINTYRYLTLGDINLSHFETMKFVGEVIDGKYVFSFHTNSYGNELWVTDGSAAGTFLLKDINTGQGSSITWSSVTNFTYLPNILVPYKNNLCFIANDGSGLTIWKTDGTSSGTQLWLDYSTSGIVIDTNFRALGATTNHLFFMGSDAAHGREVFATDTSVANTQAINITPGASGMLITSMQDWIYSSLPNRIYFFNNNNGKLYTLNDNLSYTNLGIDRPPLKSPGWINTDSLSFTASQNGGIIRTDGTPAGTYLLSEIDTPLKIVYLFKYNNSVYVSCIGFKDDTHIYRTSGYPNGTEILDSVLLAFDSRATGSWPSNFLSINSISSFNAGNFKHGTEPWITDGTVNGTIMLVDAARGYSSSVGATNYSRANNKTYFMAYDEHNARVLWATDFTPGGTRRIARTNLYHLSYTQQFPEVNGHLIFVSDSIGGWELWVTDGTVASTHLVKQINPVTSGVTYTGDVGLFDSYNNTVLFYGDDGAGKIGLWSSDGTAAGTIYIKNIGVTHNGKTFNGYHYISTGSMPNYWSVWKTDGTNAGTQLLLDSLNNDVRIQKILNGHLLFSEKISVQGFIYRMWSTDGTTANTVVLVDSASGKNMYVNKILSDPAYSHTNLPVPFELIAANDNHDLFVTDGTVNGTHLIHSFKGIITPGDYWNGSYYFSADGHTYRYDGISLYPFPAMDINAPYSTDIREMVPTTKGMLFGVNDMLNGDELWLFDGTSAHILGNICAVSQSSGATNFSNAGNGIVFCAFNNQAGGELFKLDSISILTSPVITSIDEQETKIDFNISPNPATDQLEVRLSNGLQMDKVQIYDSQGRLIQNQRTGKVSSARILVSNLQSGVYVCKVIENETVLSSRRFVKM